MTYLTRSNDKARNASSTSVVGEGNAIGNTFEKA